MIGILAEELLLRAGYVIICEGDSNGRDSCVTCNWGLSSYSAHLSHGPHESHHVCDVVFCEQLSSEGVVVFESCMEEGSSVAATSGAQTPNLYVGMQSNKFEKVIIV